MRRCVCQRTVGYYAKSKSDEMFLLRMVLPGWNLWGVEGIGPDLFWRVGHGCRETGGGCFGGVRLWPMEEIKEEGPRSSTGGINIRRRSSTLLLRSNVYRASVLTSASHRNSANDLHWHHLNLRLDRERHTRPMLTHLICWFPLIPVP